MADATERSGGCERCGTGLIVGRCYHCEPRAERGEDWMSVVYSVDWLLLRSQKQVLVRISAALQDGFEDNLALEGIIGLIDAVQDAAALETDEFSVFGRLE